MVRSQIVRYFACDSSLIHRFTGFIANHMSKPLGVAVGGGIILLELAYETGYIKINWDKVNQKLDKVSDKIEERVTGQGPSWVDKVL